MSNFHVTAALKAKAGGPSEKLILFALANWADTNGFAYPGQESLAEIAELSERSVRRCIDRLEAAGLLTKARRWRPSGARTSDAYQLHLLKSDAPVGQINAPPEFAERMNLPDNLSGRVSAGLPDNMTGRQPDNLSGRIPETPYAETPSQTARPKGEKHENAPDTSVVTHQRERKGSALLTEPVSAEPQSSPSLGSQVDAALADPESPEARAFLEANGISTDQRPLWNLKKFLRQTLGDQADHPQVVGNLTAWAAAGHTLQEIRAAWLQAVARWKREPKGGKLRPVHFFVDLLNGSYKPDSHDLREQAEAAAAVQEQAQLSAPQPGDRVRLPDGTLDTVHDFDAWSNLVELVNTTSAFRPEDLQVIQ